ncbi:MAG: hypothetical protein R3F61_06645 [Myxococcota bacterium]
MVVSPTLQRVLLGVGGLGLLFCLALVLSDFGAAIEDIHSFDDSFMFQRYARHILDGLGPVWNPGGPVAYGCTSTTQLLWVTLLMALLPSLDPQDLSLLSSGLPYLAFAGLGAWACLRTRERAPVLGSLAFLIWGFHAVPGVLVHGRSGMDTALALFVGLVVALATARWERNPTELGAAGLAFGGFVVWNTRPDLALVAFGVPGLLALFGRRWRVLAVFCAVAVALIAADLVVKSWVFGSALPLPVAAKQHGAYESYLGLARWNPGEALLTALVLGGPFLMVAFAAEPPARLVAWLLPVGLTWAYLTTVVQIMGYNGRFNVVALPWIFVLVWSGTMAPDRERLRVSLASMLGLFAVGGALQVVYPRVTPEPVLLPPPPLENINGWTAMGSVGEIGALLPAGTVIAAAEHGLVGAMAPDVSIVDLVGLHQPEFANGKTNIDLVYAQDPVLIWLPPADYSVLREGLMSHPEWASDYDFVDGAFHLGMGVRKGDAAAHAAVDAVFRKVYGVPAFPEPVRALVAPEGAAGVLIEREGVRTVVFPASSVTGLVGLEPAGDDVSVPGPHGPVEVSAGLVVFDADGPLARFPAPALDIVLACENDAGVAYRAEGRVTDVVLARSPAPGPDGFVAFVAVEGGEARAIEGFTWPEGTRELRSGDRDADGTPDAELLGWPDDAICEDGHLVLATAAGAAPLRCCGP